MRPFRRTVSYALVGAIYALCALHVFRHVSREDEPGRVTIRISQWQLETGVREAINAVIHRYEQINPHVHVVQIAVPGGPTYVSWVQTQMVGGTAPDLVQYSFVAPNIPSLFQPLSAEVMQPNPYNRGTPLEGVKWRDTFIDGMTSPDAYIEALHAYYSVAMDTHMGRLVYNKPLLKLITGSDQPPQTYRQMLAVCAQIRAYARAHGLNLVPITNSQDTCTLQAWLISVTATIGLGDRIDFQHRIGANPDDLGRSFLRHEWSFDSPEVVAMLQELKEYGEMSSPGFWDRNRDAAVTDFVTEHAVMIVAPSWEATNLLGLCSFEIAAFQYPYPQQDDPVYGKFAHGPYSEGQVTTGLPIYLNRATTHRAEAIDFLHFMTSQEGSRIFAEVSNWPPATVGVEPSKFAAQFKQQTEGYVGGCNILIPSLSIDAGGFIYSHMADLWSASGSVERFRQVMREGLDAKIRDDFRQEIITGLNNLRRVDAMAVAQAELAPGGQRPEVLPLIAVMAETNNDQNQEMLTPLAATPGGAEKSARPDPADSLPAAPALVPFVPVTDPEVLAGWKELADLHVERAQAHFESRMGAADAGVARAARFGRGICVLSRQPVSPAQLEEARRAFAELAEGGNDDVALGARFFLGRLAQAHLQVPDAPEAARQYHRLLAARADSLWAQTALARLAMLEIYALNPQSTPGERVARATELLRFVRTPAAEAELRVVLSAAIFFYHLPSAEALPHLLAAVRLGRLDWTTRRDCVLQVAELSRLAGDRQQAAEYYRIYIAENPIDARVYTVRQRLAALGVQAGGR